MLHPLLRAQLERLGIRVDALKGPGVPPRLTDLLDAVSKSYSQHDDERVRLDRTLDATSRETRSSEQLLAAERDKLQAVISSVGDGLCVLDVEGRVAALNPAAERLLGWSSAELCGKPLETALRMSGAAVARVRTALDEARAFRAEDVTCGRRDGSTFPASCVIGPIRTSERHTGFVLVFRDTSENGRMLRELAAARDAAESANRAKSDFLATMSHEIRTPMNGVFGFTNLLLETQLLPEQVEFAETIRNSAEALLAILDDILDFSKIEAGKLVLETMDFDLMTVVEDAVDLVAERGHKKGLELSSTFDRDVPQRVRGDAGRLRQVLLNLLGNAVKFTEQGGVVVRVSTSGTRDGEALLRFEVVDTGIGIPQHAQQALFRPFTQADSSTTRQFGGTGLGLAICRRLCLGMGGDIGVESALGQGSKFHFTVRLAVGPSPQCTNAGMTPVHVVVADASAASRRALRCRLESFGCSVLEAGDTAQLWAVIDSGQPFQVVLVDAQLADRDGISAVSMLRADPRTAGLPTLLLSTNRALGGPPVDVLNEADVIAKPVRTVTLARRISDSLQLPSYHREPAGAIPSKASGRRAVEPAERRKILLVEDNAVNQRLALRLLEKMGHQVDVADNGLEALAAMPSGAYHLVLMDCQMPEMDGFEATRRIRKSGESWADVTIVAMTANAMNGDRERCLEAGMDDYMTKPITAEEFRVMVTRWLATCANDDRDNGFSVFVMD
jgi:PAS domain S-box-containing protein